jgi:hypothetical protein
MEPLTTYFEKLGNHAEFLTRMNQLSMKSECEYEAERTQPNSPGHRPPTSCSSGA